MADKPKTRKHAKVRIAVELFTPEEGKFVAEMMSHMVQNNFNAFMKAKEMLAEAVKDAGDKPDLDNEPEITRLTLDGEAWANRLAVLYEVSRKLQYLAPHRGQGAGRS